MAFIKIHPTDTQFPTTLILNTAYIVKIWEEEGIQETRIFMNQRGKDGHQVSHPVDGKAIDILNAIIQAEAD